MIEGEYTSLGDRIGNQSMTTRQRKNVSMQPTPHGVQHN